MFISSASKIKTFINKYALLLMIGACVVYLAHVSALAFLDHKGLRTQLNDLGHMEQAIWQVTQGDLLMHVTDPIPKPTSRFYYHANLIFYLIAPFYALFPSAYTLLFIAVLSAATAGLLIFLLAQKILKNNSIALIFGLAFLANPLVQETVLYDFHPIIIACPLLLLILLALEKKHWLVFWMSIILLLFVKEDMTFLVIALAPFVLFYRSKLHGMLVFVTAVSYWIFLRTGLSYVAGEKIAGYLWYRLGDMGDSPEAAAKNLLKNPWQIISSRIGNNQIIYTSYLFLQGGFLAIWAPLLALVAVPNFAQNILIGGHFQTRITGVYYSGIIITAIFIASIYGVRRLSKLLPKVNKYFFLPLFVSQALIFTYIFSPLPYGLNSHFKDFAIYHDEIVFQAIKDKIPPDASVSTQNNLGAHFAARNLITKPSISLHTDYALLHISNTHHATDNGLFFRNPGSSMLGNGLAKGGHLRNSIKKSLVDPVFKNKDFGIVSYESSFYLFKKGHSRALNDAAYKEALQDIETIAN